jgi:hypothetical protein
MMDLRKLLGGAAVGGLLVFGGASPASALGVSADASADVETDVADASADASVDAG